MAWSGRTLVWPEVPPFHRALPGQQGAEGGHHQQGIGANVLQAVEEGRVLEYEKVYNRAINSGGIMEIQLLEKDKDSIKSKSRKLI